MNRAQGYAKEILSLKKEIKRLNAQLKKLRGQRKHAETNLYQHMVNYELDKVTLTYDDKSQTITVKSITPKPKVIRKKKSDKEKDAIRLCEEVGIPDPQQFYEEFMETQRNRREGGLEGEPSLTHINEGYSDESYSSE